MQPQSVRATLTSTPLTRSAHARLPSRARRQSLACATLPRRVLRSAHTSPCPTSSAHALAIRGASTSARRARSLTSPPSPPAARWTSAASSRSRGRRMRPTMGFQGRPWAALGRPHSAASPSRCGRRLCTNRSQGSRSTSCSSILIASCRRTRCRCVAAALLCHRVLSTPVFSRRLSAMTFAHSKTLPLARSLVTARARLSHLRHKPLLECRTPRSSSAGGHARRCGRATGSLSVRAAQSPRAASAGTLSPCPRSRSRAGCSRSG